MSFGSSEWMRVLRTKSRDQFQKIGFVRIIVWDMPWNARLSALFVNILLRTSICDSFCFKISDKNNWITESLQRIYRWFVAELRTHSQMRSTFSLPKPQICCEPLPNPVIEWTHATKWRPLVANDAALPSEHSLLSNESSSMTLMIAFVYKTLLIVEKIELAFEQWISVSSDSSVDLIFGSF